MSPRNKATELPQAFKTMLTLNGWSWRRVTDSFSCFEDEWVISRGRHTNTVLAVEDFGGHQQIAELLDHLTSEGVFDEQQCQALYEHYGLKWQEA